MDAWISLERRSRKDFLGKPGVGRGWEMEGWELEGTIWAGWVQEFG